MTGDFDGLVALVTGGASGIGAATADLLAHEGARVAVLDLDPPSGPHPGFRCDVTDATSVEAAVAQVVDRWGQLDVVVNNAGIGAQGDVSANDDDEWHRVLAAAADPEAERAALEARQPHGRLVTADEVARAICYLANPHNGSTAGVCLAVDGGMDSLRPRPRPPRS